MQRRPPTGNIPIELLRAVVATVDLGSFSKAAQALRLTQPAISAQMRRIKQLVGTEVFSKAGSTLILTDRGALIVKYARRILAMNDQIMSLGGGPFSAFGSGCRSRSRQQSCPTYCESRGMLTTGPKSKSFATARTS